MALPTVFKDFVTQTAILSTVALLLTPCYAAPTRQDDRNILWWQDPCGPPKIRHSRGIPTPVKCQMQIVLQNYENLYKKSIRPLYSKIATNISKTQLKRNSWLPKKVFFNKVRKDDITILPDFHYELQKYAITMQKLATMKINTSDASFNLNERSAILDLTMHQMKLLLCEVETVINETKQSSVRRIRHNYIGFNKIPASVDLTNGMVKDYSIFTNYKTFLKKCNNKMFGKRRKGKKRGKGKNKKNKKLKTNKHSELSAVPYSETKPNKIRSRGRSTILDKLRV